MTARGSAVFVLVCLACALVSPLGAALAAEDGGWRRAAEFATAAWVGPIAGAAELPASSASNFVLIAWLAFAAGSAVAAAPLAGGMLYPLSRAERAALAWRTSVRTVLAIGAFLLAFGTALGALGIVLLDARWPAGLPAGAWIVLAGLLGAPWCQGLVLAFARTLRAGRTARAWLGFALGGTLLVNLLLFAWHQWRASAAEHRPVWLAAYAIALGASIFAQRALLAAHYRRCDL